MKKYFNKALFYHDLNSFKWFLLLIPLSSIIIATMAANSVNNRYISSLDGFYNYNNTGHIINIGIPLIFLFIIILLLCFAIMGNSKRKIYLFLTSQPITKEQISFTKAVLVLIMVLPFIFVYYHILILNYIVYRDCYDFLSIPYVTFVLKQALICIVFSIAAISYVFMMNSLISNGILSAVMSVLFIMYPFLFLGGSSIIFTLPPFNKVIDYGNRFTGRVMNKIRLCLERLDTPCIVLFLISIFIVFCILLFWKYIILKLYRKIQVENLDRAFTFSSIEQLTKILLSIIVSFIPAMIITVIFSIFIKLEVFLQISGIVTYVLCLPITFKCQSKILDNLARR